VAPRPVSTGLRPDLSRRAQRRAGGSAAGSHGIFGALRSPPGHRVSVLTICNHKGGTGKTTTSIHLAAALGHAGWRVLVADFDPQGFLTRMLGVPEPAPEHSSLGLLDPEADLRTFPVRSVSGFDVIGSSMALTKALRALTKPTDVMWLRETIRAGHDYDLVLLDTAAALSVFTMNALVASDHVVVPVTPEYQPVVGAEQTWQTSGLVQSKLNPRLQTPRFLLTQVDARLSRHARYAEYLRQKYGEAVLETPIRTSSSLAVASRDGRTVFDARVTTRGAEDYAAAADELATAVLGLARPAVSESPAAPEPPTQESSASSTPPVLTAATPPEPTTVGVSPSPPVSPLTAPHPEAPVPPLESHRPSVGPPASTAAASGAASDEPEERPASAPAPIATWSSLDSR
jgi:chromosome partitioning protein